MTEHETTPDQLRYIAKITAGRTAGGFSWDEVLEAAAAQLDQNRAEQRHADGVTGEPEWSTRPVPSSDTPSDERACERPGCGHPMDDHDGEHGCEDCVMCPAYVPPIGSRLHGQWAGSNEDPVRWCALCGTWEDEADWITHSGHASLFPTDDVRHADAVTAEPEWSTRPVPSSDTPSDERRPVDVTALPEWAALLAAHAEAVKAEEALDQALATGSSYNDPQEPFRVAAARWSRVSLMASSLIHAAAADRGDRADG